MKNLLFLGLAVLFICGVTGTANAKDYDWKEVKDHKGEKITACGEIKDQMDIGTAVLLGMGIDVASQDPSVVGIEIDYEVKDKLPADLYVGKKICVTGEVYENPLGGGSIKVTDAKQIKVK